MLNTVLNCAVVGLGIGEQHANAILMHPQAKLAAVCDLNNDKALSFLQKNNLDVNLSRNFSAILDDKNINLVSIASFDDDHFEQVKACLEHGKHVFVEKPLCQTETQLNEIITVWKKNKLGLASNLILRKAPLYIWLQRAISSGELGEIYAIDMEYLYGRIHKITEGWRSTIDNYSVMAGGGIHLIDLMMRFLEKKPIRVQSSINKIATRGTAFRYHDFHAATFNFENGIIGRVVANFGCMHRHQHIVRVFGTRGTFIYDDMGTRIYRDKNENVFPEIVSFLPKPTHKGLLLVDFIDRVISGEFGNGIQKEFDLMGVVLAADKAICLEGTSVIIE